MARKNSLNIDNTKFDSTKLKWVSTKPSSGKKSCPKAVKETVWRKYNGNRMTGKCYVCGVSITFTNFEAGHNKPRSRGGEWTVENLRPICRSCNRSMGTKSIEVFKRIHFSKKTTKKTTKKKIAKRKPTSPLGIQPIKLPKLGF